MQPRRLEPDGQSFFPSTGEGKGKGKGKGGKKRGKKHRAHNVLYKMFIPESSSITVYNQLPSGVLKEKRKRKPAALPEIRRKN